MSFVFNIMPSAKAECRWFDPGLPLAIQRQGHSQIDLC
jgi:hypothetical protein